MVTNPVKVAKENSASFVPNCLQGFPFPFVKKVLMACAAIIFV